MARREGRRGDEELRIDVAEGGEQRRTPFNSPPLPFNSPPLPFSARRQAALLAQMESPNADERSPSSGSSTPSRKRLPPALRKNDRGETLLHVAARTGDVKRCKNLLLEGAIVNQSDFAGWTPLHEACAGIHVKVAKILIKAGADVNACANDNGDTPLHDASSRGSEKLIGLLLKHNADRNIKNREGLLPIGLIPESSETRLVFEKYREGVSPPPSSSSSSTSSSDSEETKSPEKEKEMEEMIRRKTQEKESPKMQERSGALEPRFQMRPRPAVERKDTDDDEDDDEEELPARRPTRSAKGGRGRGIGQVVSRRSTPRTAARRGNAKSTAIATSEASPPQRTTARHYRSLNTPTREMAEHAEAAEKMKRKKREDVYEFHDEDSGDEMMKPSTSGPLIKRPKNSPATSPEPARRVPPLRISLKPEEQKEPSPSPSPPPTSKPTPKAPPPKKKKLGRPNKKAKEAVEEEVVPPVVLPKPVPPSTAKQARSAPAATPRTRKRSPRKTAQSKAAQRKASPVKAVEAKAGPSSAPITSGALEPAGTPKRLTRSYVKQDQKTKPTTPKEPTPYFVNQFEYLSVSSTPKPVKKPEPPFVPSVRPFEKAYCARPPPDKTKQMNTFIMKHPIADHPDVQKVVRDIYSGNPERTQFTMKAFIKKKMASEKAHKNKVPPRPISENEKRYWYYLPTDDFKQLMIRLEKKSHEQMPADCPPEMIPTWKQLEKERFEHLAAFKRERVKLRLFLERQFIRNRNMRWRHENGDYTRPLGIFRISWQLASNNPGILEEKSREPEARTAADTEAMALKKIEDLYDYHRMIGETISNVQINTWRLWCSRKNVSEEYKKKEIARKFAPDLKAMCQRLKFDY